MCVFFFNDTATTEIYTFSLHDALPISDVGTPQAGDRAPLAARRGPGAAVARAGRDRGRAERLARGVPGRRRGLDRKSTRLNSSHANISYAVFCLKKTNDLECVDVGTIY